jgi:hypothetical protein
MTGKHGFLDALKQVAFEDEPAPQQHTPPPAAPAFSTPPADPHPFASPAASAAPIAAYTLPIDAGVVPDSDEVYQRVLGKTDFEGTDIAATIHKFLDPLKAIPDSVMPPNIKFKTAVIQATAQAGLTEDSILASFDTLKARLQQEKDAFGDKAQQFLAREVTGRQDQINQITEQISQLQQELARLSNELVEAQGKSSHAQSQFAAALQRRNGEIEQQKAMYTALLKG